MLIIFGWGNVRTQDFGGVAPTTCPTCNNQVWMHHLKAVTWFSLFFIPLIPYRTRHLLTCPICSNGIELVGQQVHDTDWIREVTASHQRNEIPDAEYAEKVSEYWVRLTPINTPDQGRPPSQAQG